MFAECLSFAITSLLPYPGVKIVWPHLLPTPHDFKGNFLKLISQIPQCLHIHQMGKIVVQLCLTLCEPMDCSTPGLPVFHHFPELAQTHVH